MGPRAPPFFQKNQTPKWLLGAACENPHAIKHGKREGMGNPVKHCCAPQALSFGPANEQLTDKKPHTNFQQP